MNPVLFSPTCHIIHKSINPAWEGLYNIPLYYTLFAGPTFDLRPSTFVLRTNSTLYVFRMAPRNNPPSNSRKGKEPARRSPGTLPDPTDLEAPQPPSSSTFAIQAGLSIPRSPSVLSLQSVRVKHGQKSSPL